MTTESTSDELHGTFKDPIITDAIPGGDIPPGSQIVDDGTRRYLVRPSEGVAKAKSILKSVTKRGRKASYRRSVRFPAKTYGRRSGYRRSYGYYGRRRWYY